MGVWSSRTLLFLSESAVMRKILLLATLLFASLHLFAQTVSQENTTTSDSTLMKKVDVEDVVITSDRQVRPIRSVPVITHVVRNEEIQKLNPRSMVDVMEYVLPGLEFSIHGGQDQVTVQGLSGSYVLFLVDGERIPNDGGNTVDLTRIDPNNIERIEMVRGSSSALYGSNAIGGVINIITRTAKRPIEGSYTGLYDHQQGIQRHNLMVGVVQKGWKSTTSGGWSYQPFYDLPLKNAQATTRIPGNEIWNLAQKVGYTNTNGRFKAELNGAYSHREQFEDFLDNYNLYHSLKVGGNTQYRFNDSYNLDGAYNFDIYLRDEIHPTRTGIQRVFDYQTHTARAQLNAKPWGEALPTFNAGVDCLHEQSRGNRFRDSLNYNTATTITPYIQAEWHIIEKLTVTSGVRGDIHSEYKFYATPRVALLWREKYWALRGSYSMGFRSPTLKELFMEWRHPMAGGFTIQGNPDLKPETSQMAALAPELTLGDFYLNSTLYFNYFNNQIVQYDVLENGNRYRRHINRDRSHILGVQTMATYRILSSLNLRLNHSFVYDVFEVKDKDGRLYDLSQVRPHTGSAALDFHYMFAKTYGLGVDISGKFYGPLHTAFPIEGSKMQEYRYEDYPAYLTLRASISGSWKRYVTLTLGCENLLDYKAEQSDVVTSLSPGRSFYISLALRY